MISIKKQFNHYLFTLSLLWGATFSGMAISSADHHSFFEKDWKILASIHVGDKHQGNMHQVFKHLSALDIDVAGADTRGQIIDILINDFDFTHLTSLGYELSISEVKGVTASPDEEYKNPVEIEQIIEQFSNDYPSLTKKISIGKSLEGRDIWAIKISDNAKTSELKEPSVLFNSMHHAREVMGPEVSIDIMETLLTSYGTDPRITAWVDENEIWVIPMFNVDGNNKMWSKDKWWRKNTRGGYGVDLNRNYPSGWNKCKGSSGWKRSQTYRGPSPASEPETQAMMEFIKNIRPVFDISYHAYSEMVIYPLGCSPERTSNKDVVEKIGNEIARLLDYSAGTAWELLYNADGGDIDWMYDAYQVIPFVIELNSRKEGFHPNYLKWRDVTVERNKVGWMYLLDRLNKSGIRGLVTVNGAVEKDYSITVYKKGLSTIHQVYRGHETGMYHLVLNTGEYQLDFKKQFMENGKWIEKTIKKELVIVDEKLLELNIDL